MTRIIVLLCMTLLLSPDSIASELKGSRPNIVILIPDDISFGSLSAYGGGVPTPHLDDLKAKGISFENFHVSPSCAPTRAALMTGRHEFYAGVTHTINMRDRPNLDMRFLPEVLKEAGYATGMFGKWHLGDEKEYQPDSRGFDEVYMHGGGGIGQRFAHSADFPGNRYNDPILRHNDKVIRTKGYCTNLFHEQGMKWMKEQAESGHPFFCYLPANVVHTPMYPPRDEYLLDKNNTYGTGTRPEIVNRILKNYDNNVGRMMEFLGQEGLLESTLVIFLTDNGGSTGNKGLRGSKLSAYDGGSHVPCFFYWKGVLEGGISSNKMVAHMDFFLTFADLAGRDEEPPGTEAWDGRSMLPLLENLNAPWPSRYLMTHCGRWKNGNEPSDSKYIHSSVKDERFQLVNNSELYDLIEDPGQKKDVMDKYPGEASRLRKSFDAFWEDVRPRMINEEAYKDGPVQPYFELFKEAFGEEAFKEADARGQIDREEYNTARRSRMNNRNR